jgi:hypothetical protein
MAETEPTVRSVNVAPIFNYTRSITVLKRFIEQLTRLESEAAVPLATDHSNARARSDRLVGYIAANINHARTAVSEIMADDIKQQIADEVFPSRFPPISFHEFIPYEFSKGSCEECGERLDTPTHTL